MAKVLSLDDIENLPPAAASDLAKTLALLDGEMGQQVMTCLEAMSGPVATAKALLDGEVGRRVTVCIEAVEAMATPAAAFVAIGQEMTRQLTAYLGSLVNLGALVGELLAPGTPQGDNLILLRSRDEQEREAAVDRLLERLPYDAVLGDFVQSPASQLFVKDQWYGCARAALLAEWRCESVNPDRPMQDQLDALLTREAAKHFALLAACAFAVKRQTASSGTSESNRRGPTVRTEERAYLYKEIKGEHPEWGYDTVARRANEVQSTDIHTGDTVRYAYRGMGWKWERGDRIR